MEWVADRRLDRIDRAAGAAETQVDVLRAMFLSHVAFVIEYPGVPRMMFGELQHTRATPAKQAARTLMRRYVERVSTNVDHGDQVKKGQVLAWCVGSPAV